MNQLEVRPHRRTLSHDISISENKHNENNHNARSGTLGDFDGGTPSAYIQRGNTGLKTSGNTIYGDFTADADGIQEFTVNGDLQMLTGYVLTTVPEPSSALLGGLGMLALLRRRR